MTTQQIDALFTSWLVSAFTVSELSEITATQREVMRHTLVYGLVSGIEGVIEKPNDELINYLNEFGTEAGKTKAGHCVQEALMIMKMSN